MMERGHSIFNPVEVIPRALDIFRKWIRLIEGGQRRCVVDRIEPHDGAELRIKIGFPAFGPPEDNDLRPLLFDEDDFLHGGDSLVVRELVRAVDARGGIGQDFNDQFRIANDMGIVVARFAGHEDIWVVVAFSDIVGDLHLDCFDVSAARAAAEVGFEQ